MQVRSQLIQIDPSYLDDFRKTIAAHVKAVRRETSLLEQFRSHSCGELSVVSKRQLDAQSARHARPDTDRETHKLEDIKHNQLTLSVYFK